VLNHRLYKKKSENQTVRVVKVLKDAYVEMGQSCLESRIERFGVCPICFSVNGRRDKPADVELGLDKLGVVKQ
jgi:hypothetical protein